MPEFDIDAELRNLLKAERDKARQYIEPLTAEHKELVEIFQEHVVSLSMFSDDYVVEEYPEHSTDTEDDKDDTYLKLDELIQKDIERYGVFSQGEMEVSGEGYYIGDFDGQCNPVEFLRTGEILRGEISKYRVAPLVNTDASIDKGFTSMPGLWVMLNNATIVGAGGNEVGRNNQVLVPMTMPGLEFGKVIKPLSDSTSVETAAITAKDPDVREVFAGDFFQERCNEIENDLNYNEYDEIEELQVARREYQHELDLHVGEIKPDEQVIITVIGAMLPTGGTTDLFACNAYYDRPTIIKFSNSWRVVHGFSVVNDANEIEQFFHVFPETIRAAYRNI